MVAVRSAETAAFLRQPPVKVAAVLLYGTDAGLVAERARQLARRVAETSKPPGEILRIDDADLESDPDRLAIELATIPMFGGRKVIRTTHSRRVNAGALKALVEGGTLEGFLIVEAGSLKADDAARALFEKAANAAAVGCHAEEGGNLEALVREVLAPHRLEIAPDALRLLVSRLGADRALSRAEIEKLALYAAGKGEVTESDIDAVVGDAAELAVDRIVSAAASGRAGEAVAECERFVSSGESPQLVLIMLMRHLQRLHRVRAATEQGAAQEEALRALRPPLFYKQRDAFLAELRQWTAGRLLFAIGRINDVMKAARGGVMDDFVVTERLLIEISRLATPQAAARTPAH